MEIVNNTTRPEWISMKSDYFIKYVVEPLNMMDAKSFKKFVTEIEYPNKLEFLIQKCWTEQDKMPSQDPDHYNDAYEETLPIVLLLEKILSNRISTENDSTVKKSLTQQLSLITLILSPHKLENTADSINQKKRK